MKCQKLKKFQVSFIKILILIVLCFQIDIAMQINSFRKFDDKPILSIKNHHLKFQDSNVKEKDSHSHKQTDISQNQSNVKSVVGYIEVKAKQNTLTKDSGQFFAHKNKNGHIQKNSTKQQSCDSWIKYSIPLKSKITQKNDCKCPNGTYNYQSRTGQKCLEPEPVGYPQLVDLTCGFFAFLIPSIVAYVCRHQQQVERHRFSIHSIGKQHFSHHEKQDNKQNIKNSSPKIDFKQNYQVQQPQNLKNVLKEKSKFASSRIGNLRQNIDNQNRLYYSTVSKTPKYASATDPLDLNLTGSLKYGYASAKDLSLIRKQFS